MDDLISRQAAIEEIRTYIAKPNISDDESEIKGFNDGLELAISVLSVLPSVQPEQKRGKWLSKMLDNFRMYEVVCSECGARYIGNYDSYDEPYDFKYCPNCGARMDGETECD